MNPSNENVRALLWQLVAAHPHLDGMAISEYPFAKDIGRKWRFDLAFPPRMVAVEVDGGAYVAGRHVRGAGFEADCEKQSEAAALGWRVLHVTPRQVESGKALEWLERALAQ